VIKSVMEGGLPKGIVLTTDELAHKSVYEALKASDKSHWGALEMESGDKSQRCRR